jgi:type VI secretion system protein ImpE
MSVDIQSLLQEDKLDEAIAAMNDAVRANPADVNRRANLVELLCYAGNLERADKLLDAISSLDPSTGIGVALFRQLVRAEQARQQFYTEGRMPEFLRTPDAAVALELRAAVSLRQGEVAEAAALIEERDALRAPISGTVDGVAFDDFRDLDDICSAHLEVLTSNGKYYWVPFTSIVKIDFHKPERRRDLLWRGAFLTLHDDPDGEVYIPTVYFAADSTPSQRLGHETDFVGGDGAPISAKGLRSFLVGEESKTILELGKVTFTPGDAGPAA